MEVWKLVSIFNDVNRFLTLNEIYDEYAKRYEVDAYADFKAAIRTEIYRNCVDRDLNTLNKKIFISFSVKGTRGQKYGLYNWVKLDSDNETFQAIELIKTKPILYVLNNIQRIARDLSVKECALKRANHKCEVNELHDTFIRKKDGHNYTEAHHLIPIELQFTEKFKDINLDCVANVVSLCSNCHNQLHYGAHIENVLYELFIQRRADLEASGVYITFEELLSFYK